MAERVTVWFDREANFLEVTFSDALGFMRETANNAISLIILRSREYAKNNPAILRSLNISDFLLL